MKRTSTGRAAAVVAALALGLGTLAAAGTAPAQPMQMHQGGHGGQHGGHGAHAAPGQRPGAGPHAGHGAGAAAGDASPVVRAFRDVNDRMHREMDIAFSGDADRDFAEAMIPHHQGAIEMARIVVEHGKDPELKALAEEIIRAQEAEIAQLRAWLRRNPR
jgi:hypothetical protein